MEEDARKAEDSNGMMREKLESITSERVRLETRVALLMSSLEKERGEAAAAKRLSPMCRKSSARQTPPPKPCRACCNAGNLRS